MNERDSLILIYIFIEEMFHYLTLNYDLQFLKFDF